MGDFAGRNGVHILFIPALACTREVAEPSGDGDCVEWGPDNALNDIPHDEDRDYVCEREPAG